MAILEVGEGGQEEAVKVYITLSLELTKFW